MSVKYNHISSKKQGITLYSFSSYSATGFFFKKSHIFCTLRRREFKREFCSWFSTSELNLHYLSFIAYFYVLELFTLSLKDEIHIHPMKGQEGLPFPLASRKKSTPLSPVFAYKYVNFEELKHIWFYICFLQMKEKFIKRTVLWSLQPRKII